ncbi:MAG: hypothetical protein M9887_06230 [Chitinophagales bacterium]|nr:hypothetical protein [Chitinophagales bacterium]
MLDLFKYWMKWWRHILIFCVVAIILSVIVSSPFIMKPYYQSKIIFYPANPSINDRGVLFNERNVVLDNFGSKDDINRFLSIANSGEIVTFMVDSFKLRVHYRIKEPGYYYVSREFSSNYKAIKNDLGAIELQIMDTDPVLAQKMVKAALHQIDKIYRQIVSENKRANFELLNNESEWESRALRLLADSLNRLKSHSDYSYDKDGNLIGDESLRMLNKQFDAQNDYVKTLYFLTNQFNISLSDKYPSVYIVEDAVVPEKKVKPIRWLIVGLTAVASFIIATIIIILIEIIQHVRITKETSEF